MKKVKKWKTVGHISVDAGIVQLGDPCYQYKNHDEWLKYIENTGIEKMKKTLEIGHENGLPGQAVVISSGYGDGYYPVEVIEEKGRVKEVRIKFF